MTEAPPWTRLEIHPATPDRWADLEVLFGARGACAGCWCMWWRLARSVFERQKGGGNRKALQDLIDGGTVPGLIAYADGHPVGWVALAPREEYPPLARSRVLKPVDDRPVWSVVCFFIARPFRRRGLTVRLLEAAAGFARQRGASMLEGYPVEPKKGAMPDVFVYTGLSSAYRQAGFTEVARRSPPRPIMRLPLL
jgi:GNAT superfamily N-acetyltransferase